MYNAFRKYDTEKNGFIGIADLKKVLVDLNYFLSDEQFSELITRYIRLLLIDNI